MEGIGHPRIETSQNQLSFAYLTTIFAQTPLFAYVINLQWLKWLMVDQQSQQQHNCGWLVFAQKANGEEQPPTTTTTATQSKSVALTLTLVG